MLKKMSTVSIGRYAAIMAAMILLVVFGVLTGGKLFTPMNITNIFIQNSYLFFLTISLFFCILTGNTDLSVGSVIGLVGAIIGISYVTMGLPMPVAILCGLVLGMVIGAFHGFLITKFNFTPFIITLAGNFVYRGITQYLLKGSTLGPLNPELKTFAAGYILSDWRIAGVNVVCVLVPLLIAAALFIMELRKRGNLKELGIDPPPMAQTVAKNALLVVVACFICYFWNRHKGVPIVIVFAALVIGIYAFVANNTVVGRRIYAVGGDRNSAKLSGVNVKKIMFLVFFNSAFIATIGAIIVAGRVGATATNAGDGYQMDAIAACYIGGCSGSGGSGSLLFAIVGAFVVCILNNGMTLMGLGSDIQQVVKGLVLLTAVAFDVVSRSKSSAN